MNHEIPITCPNCGHEYDARLHWLVCPQCGHETTHTEALGRSIEDLNFSTRIQNCFRSHEIRTIGDLVAKTPFDLMAYRHFGLKCLQEVREALAKEGLELKNDYYSVILC